MLTLLIYIKLINVSLMYTFIIFSQIEKNVTLHNGKVLTDKILKCSFSIKYQKYWRETKTGFRHV